MQADYSIPDWDRIAHLFKLGILASLLALIGGDMLLGWGTADLSLTGWLSVGSLITFSGLLLNISKAKGDK